MEWVETTGRTIQEAKDKALDQLGVAEDDAEFEVLDEPRAGLFGRMRGEARVRARVRPTQARQKVERRDRKRKKDERTDGAPVAAGASAAVIASVAVEANITTTERVRTPRPPRAPKPIPNTDEVKEHAVDARQVGEEARKFMDELVKAFGLEGTSELVEDGDDLEVRVQGSNLGLLVGPRGSTLQAVQDLARVASQRRLGDHDTRLRIDVGGYRERRREALGRFALQIAGEVRVAGEARALEPMSSSDRKIIHDALGAEEGIVTHSEGDDPNRRVVIAPANA